MSQTECNSYFPLILLLMIPILLFSSINDNDLLTDEQKLEKQETIEQNKKEFNENLTSFFAKDSIIMLIPLPIMLMIGFAYYNNRYRNNTLFVFLILFSILYALWYFNDFDINGINFPQINNMKGT